MNLRQSVLVIAAFLLLFTTAYAQPGGGGNPGGGTPVPISGIELLIAAGGLLGLWKLGIKRSSKKS